MEFILDFIRTNTFFVVLSVGFIILFILYIVNIVKLSKLRRNHINFMKKVGNGQNIQETIEKYMEKVIEVKKENEELKKYCQQLDKTIMGCIQKVGLVRYSAFKDTGSDLSFALALLNEENSGVILNGIYSREMSNIYSKPIEKGKSTYTLSEEEKEAINKAIN